MKRALKLGIAALGLAVAAGPAHAAGKLSIYHWFEYMPQELLDKFAAETGIEVTMDTYDSNEAMLASLKAGKLGSYDVAVPGDYMVEIMAGEGMLDTIADGELANVGNIEPQWVDVPFDPGRKHSIPYQWGSTSFSVNRDVFGGDINTTSIIFDPPRSSGAGSTCSTARARSCCSRRSISASRNAPMIANSSRRWTRCSSRQRPTGRPSAPTSPRTCSSPAMRRRG